MSERNRRHQPGDGGGGGGGAGGLFVTAWGPSCVPAPNTDGVPFGQLGSAVSFTPRRVVASVCVRHRRASADGQIHHASASLSPTPRALERHRTLTSCPLQS